ncbi:MAG: Flp family type IVb pilin [Moraxellaceae bacterium]
MKLATLKARVMAFIKEEEGATAIEYALIAALIAIAIVTALGSAGTSIKGLFEDVAETIGGTTPAGGGGGS